MNLRAIQITLITLLTLFQLSLKAEEIALQSVDINDISLAEHLYYIADESLTIEQVLSHHADKFVSNSTAPYRPSPGSHSFYRLDFDNSGPAKTLTLRINNNILDEVQIYKVVEQQVIEQVLLGDLQHNTSHLENSFPHYTIDFPANTKTKIYLRVYSVGATIIPLSLHDSGSFQALIYKSFITWGAFIGIVILMTVYNILLYIGIKDKIYLFYIGYILTMMVLLGSLYGFGFHIFPFELQKVFNIHIVVLNYVIAIFAILFALYFLRYDQQKGPLYQISLYFCYGLAALAIANLFIPEAIAVKLYYLCQLWVLGLIAWICLPKITSDNKWSAYYLFSWVPLIIGTTIAQLLLLDWVAHHYLTQNALLFGLVVEIGFISIALAERFRSDEKQRLYDVTHDSVTLLPNSIILTESTRRQIDANNPFTLILFQAERFSEIKPALGLDAANSLIKAIVDNVADYFQEMNNLLVFEYPKQGYIRLSRLNDDTFGLLLMDQHDKEELSYIVLTIQEAVSTPIHVGGYNVSTQCAVGLVSFPEFTDSADMIVQKAKHALDIAKKEDTKYAFYCGEQNLHVHEQLQLAADLQKAIDHDSLEIYHQPQIDLVSQTVCGNEALLRWIHPERGFISPEIFVSLAEDTGIINQLTEWVITRSLEQHAKLIDAGFKQNISINLSAKDLTQPGLIAHIMTTIADLCLDPATIIFELTESATSDDPLHALKTINQLHELGLKVAIDDFGTGYSSLEYLSKLPFHELKVDKSFVLNILQSQRNQAITKTTIEMAKNLDIFVVAEGIETVAIEQLLCSYGCEIGQGYLYSKPLPLEDFLIWLDSDSPYVQKLKSKQPNPILDLTPNESLN